MSAIVTPRSAWHAGRPTNNNGTPRPLLARPVAGGLAVHYTGSPIRARNLTDPAEVYMPALQARAQRDEHSFEYNDVIPPRADRSVEVWEYAGDYLAAHAKANNPFWYAIQFAIGVDNHPKRIGYDRTRPTVWEPLTDEMIEAFRWRRHDLVQRGILAADHAVREHSQLPGAATECCGNAVRARWADLLKPWQPTSPPQGDNVQYFRIEDGPTVWGTSDNLAAVRLDPDQFAARKPTVIERRTRDQLAGMTFPGGLTIASVR